MREEKRREGGRVRERDAGMKGGKNEGREEGSGREREGGREGGRVRGTEKGRKELIISVEEKRR